ncbi:MAG TPA: 50S ribosomal protein L11 methyltransferase, partial [Oribacterium sp.]|nr:50S ribosomal protein L11 methyltransferase [Oribacterium sp.]
VPAVQDNLKANGLPATSFDMVVGNVIGDDAIKSRMGLSKYDIVVANILAPVIVLLTGEVGPLLKQGGIFITSGILDQREAEVLEAFRQHADIWEVLEVNHQGEWVNVTARRK